MTVRPIIPKKEIEKLENLTNEVIDIKKRLHLGTASLTPLNYIEEMDKFFSSTTSNPQYVYKQKSLPDFSKKLVHLKVSAGHLQIPEDLKAYLLEFLDDLNYLYLTKQTIGQNDFSDHAHRLFDWGSDRLDLLLTSTPAVEFQMHIKHKLKDAEYIKNRFEKVLLRYGISSFTVKIDTFSPHIINVGFNSINIGSEIKRFECNVDRLVVHEIESHVLQTENAKRAATGFAELTKYSDQTLYGEGLAIYNEISTRKITPSAFEMYYFRIKAVRMLNKSFREIYDTLAEVLTAQRAFIMTYRVKRGLTDTSQPGGFPKDAAYLLGFHEIESLVSEKFPRKLLYATKSPILSKLLDKYGLLDIADILTPKFR